jgi:type I restriction enzyme S subunit
MRELVLELAVQGRLTSALPSDGTVPSVIEFRKNAAALANSLVLRSPKESVEEAEPPFDVPTHWRWMALADIGAAQTGTTPSTADHEAFNGDVPFIKPADILPNSIDYSNESLTRHGAESGSRLAPSGSLLMVCIGTIGKCNLIERECAFNQQINSLTPVDAVDSRYLLVAARSRSFQDAAWKKSSSTTIAILNKGKWLSIPVPLPPLAEQKRIVAKVDELMALCDRLEAQQQERETRHAVLARASLARFADAPTPANLPFLFHPLYAISPADLRKSILTLAVQGKLVPQDPNDEPAGVFLEAIAKQRAKLLGSDSLRKTKPCRQFTSDEAPNDIPATWAWTMLGEVTDIGTGSTPSRTEASFWIGGTIPWITSGSTSRSPITEGDELVTPAAVKAHRLRVYPPGTLLVALYGQGKTRGQVAALEIAATINQACAAICPLDGIPSMQGYLKLLLEKQYDEMRLLSAGGAQPNLNVQKIKEVFVPLPPLAEQRRIVAKVSELMALMDALETQLATSRATAEKLLAALVAELTEGTHASPAC